LLSDLLCAQSFSDDCDYVLPQQANTWYFVNNAGVSFNNSVEALTNNNVLTIGSSTSVMSDANGNLLFLTDGIHVWDNTFEVMPGGTQLAGNYGCTQTAVIVQNPDDELLYYIFTVDKLFPPSYTLDTTQGLNFSILYMANRDGKGDVTSANIKLLPEVTEKITAVRHANGSDIWVIAHGYEFDEVPGDNDGDAFYAFLVTGSGVSTTPVVSHTGHVHSGLLRSNNNVGYMKASSDGTRIGLAIFGKGDVPGEAVIEVFDFDASTGSVNYWDGSEVNQYPGAFGVEFSPDASKLYVTTTPLNPTEPVPSLLYQFDLDSPDPFDNPQVIHSLSFVDAAFFGALQLGPNGRIYVAKFYSVFIGNEVLSVIENPNRPGSACNFKLDGLSLEGRKGNLGLPNFMQGYLDIPHFLYENHCFGDTSKFQIRNYINIDSQSWNFGDPASGAQNTGTAATPLHRFTSPGTFSVSVTENFNGGSFPAAEDIIIHPLPPVDLGDDFLFLYPGSSFTLDAGEGYDYYFWNGSDVHTGRYFSASDTGMYYVKVVDFNCCYNYDSVWVLPSQVFMPNAFSPNSDNVNDIFLPVGLPGGVYNFNMIIFNRWGRLVFESNEFTEGWDGKVNGEPAPIGLYIYKTVFDVELDFGKFVSVSLTGHVTLLR
jgi:gliding motility-associated-like protein